MRTVLTLASPIAVGLVVALGAPQEARAADLPEPMSYESWYIGGFGAGVFTHANAVDFDLDTGDVRFNTGFGLGIVAGTHLLPGLRSELELEYQRYTGKSHDDGDAFGKLPLNGTMQTVTLMANLWRDFDLGGGVAPYLGFGLGLGFSDIDLDYNDDPVDGPDTSLAAQAGLGVRVPLGSNVTGDIGYRFKGLVDVFTLGDTGALGTYYGHGLRLGVTYSMGEPEVLPVVYPSAPPWYLGLFAAGVFAPVTATPNDGGEAGRHTFDAGLGVGLVAGTQLAPGLRGEAELSFQGYNPDEYVRSPSPNTEVAGHVRQYLALFSLWQDIGTGGIVPYFGAGLGIGLVDSRFDAVNGSNEVTDNTVLGLAGQFGAGLRLAATPELTLDFGYRYKGTISTLLKAESSEDANGSASLFAHVAQFSTTWHMGAYAIEPAADLDAEHANWYVSLAAGGVFGSEAGLAEDPQVEYQFGTGWMAGLALGHHITPTLRGELEASVLEAQVRGKRGGSGPPDFDPPGTHHQVQITANLWKDFDLGTIQPYIGGGLGMGIVKVDFPDQRNRDIYKDHRAGFATQAGLGIRTALTDNLIFDAGYRYKTVVDVLSYGRSPTGFLSNMSGTYEAHGVQAALAWSL